LEQEGGYTTLIQPLDFLPGSNFVADMDTASQLADRIIVVLSPDYLDTLYTFEDWTTAFKPDPSGKQNLLLPIHVRECRYKLRGMLESIASIDLVGQDEQSARARLLAGVQSGRSKPEKEAWSPDTVLMHPDRPVFPGITRLWNVPSHRNPFFTGRGELLTQLSATLAAGQPVGITQPQAISGLGGIGKTQIAIEYAYRHRQDYPAILWTLADTRESLVSGYVGIARLLHLPERDEQDQTIIVQAVKQWLTTTHSAWLLILDNADDLAVVREFLPPRFAGHILLTTRAQATGGLAHPIEVDTMLQEVGAKFLLRRAKLVAPDAPLEEAAATDKDLAMEICKELGGLPLALDQAGAYIEETACSLSDYLVLYRKRRSALLQRRGGLITDHPEPVASTWSLSFEKVEQVNPPAADLLRLCAFLYSESIPEEIITDGASHLGTSLQPIASNTSRLNATIEALQAYSLVSHDIQERTLTVHRLVQAVLRDRMSREIRRQWEEYTVRAVNEAFPQVEFATWQRCQRILLHAQVCAELIEQEDMTFPETALLLTKTGTYLVERAEYAEAEPLYLRALEIRERLLGANHPDTASSLNNLALLYQTQGRYTEAEPLYQRALSIYERQLGGDHLDTALNFNNLAYLYNAQGKYAQAEPLLKRALEIYEQQLGADHPDTVSSLNNLAALYQAQGKYTQAEPLLRRALEIYEQQLGADHPDTANSLNNLAALYQAQGKYAQAEPVLRRALEIYEQQLGADHPDTANSLNNLAYLYNAQGKYSEAEPLLRRALEIRERQLGADHPDTANSLNNLAALYQAQGKYTQAEPLLRRALEIYEQQLGADHPDTASSLNNLAYLYNAQGKYAQAEPLLRRALEIYEQQLGADHPDTASSLNNLALLYQTQGKYVQAEPLLRRALATCEQHLGSEHPNTSLILNNLAQLYVDEGKYAEAEPLYQRALFIYEQHLGPEHPNIENVLKIYVVLLEKQGLQAEAERLEARIHMIQEEHSQNKRHH
jgi:tetratricopeptide (TPR) repeat protein